MSQSRVNLATAKRELAERQDEMNLCMVELKHAQEVVAAGGTGPKVLSVRERVGERGAAERRAEELGTMRRSSNCGGPGRRLCRHALCARGRTDCLCVIHSTRFPPLLASAARFR